MIEWDDELKCVKIEWKGFADGPEYREVHEKILEALANHNGHKMIADTRGMRAISPADQEWVTKEWGPRAAAAGLQYSALILPKSAVGQMSLQRVIGNWSSGDLPEPPSAHFDNLEDAKKWLRSMP